MRCPNCGAESNDNVQFCHSCGAPMTPEAIPPQEQAPDGGAYPYQEQPRTIYAEEPVVSQASAAPPLPDRQQPPKKKRTALIITIVALIVIIAVIAGIIVGISLSGVSAAEIQKAKDNYLPPAKAFRVDTSQRDPSNDQIRFTYDDRDRIITCSYTLKGMKYDQTYTYDDQKQIIIIKTEYKEYPIINYEITYNQVTVVNTFEEVDGYYIRLDEDSFNNGVPATEAPTHPVTQPPTQPVTQPPTESATTPPTEQATESEDAYLQKLVGTYKGSYVANQGETGLTLTVYREGDEYKALFDFYNLPGKDNAKAGKYLMNVSYRADEGLYYLDGYEWLEQPENYSFANLRGKLSGDVFSGEENCPFTLTREAQSASEASDGVPTR